MWSDTVLAFERGHLLRLTLWGAGSVLAGSLLFMWIAMQRRVVPLLGQFAVQMVAWGVLDLAIVSLGWSRLGLRDFTGALQLQNLQWLMIGLDTGGAAVGVTLVAASYRMGPRPGGIGAGMGIIVQALARLLFDIQLLVSIGRLS
jgi:hypothetical protein